MRLSWPGTRDWSRDRNRSVSEFEKDQKLFWLILGHLQDTCLLSHVCSPGLPCACAVPNTGTLVGFFPCNSWFPSHVNLDTHPSIPQYSQLYIGSTLRDNTTLTGPCSSPQIMLPIQTLSKFNNYFKRCFQTQP